jgi:hypothetical protein
MKNRTRRFLEFVPLFVFTVPLFFCLHTLNYYFGLIEPSILFPGILFYLLVPICLLFLLKIILRSYAKAAVFLLFVMLLFYPFQYIHDSIRRFTPLLSRYSVLLTLIFILACFLAFYLVRTKSSFQRFFLAVNSIFMVLVLVEVGELGYHSVKGTGNKNFIVNQDADFRNPYKACDSCVKPDIYFLLFDEYTNSKTLDKEFNFDNSYMDKYLKSNGFRVIERSTSNYNITPIAIASTLNMNYLKGKYHEKVELKRFLQGAYAVENNVLTKILAKEGYEINNYSLFNLGEASTKIAPFISKFNDGVLFGETFYHKARRDIGWTIKMLLGDSSLSEKSISLMEEDIRRINATYHGAIHEAKKNKVAPQFTYCHFLNVHGPWYFDSTGKRLPPMHVALAGANRTDYLNNIIYANKSFIIPIVDSISNYARRPYIIILQGDHGFTENPEHKKNLVFQNLNAWYFSDQDYDLLHDSISSVNTFRIILNKYFKQNIPLLKDSSIYLEKIAGNNPVVGQ